MKNLFKKIGLIAMSLVLSLSFVNLTGTVNKAEAELFNPLIAVGASVRIPEIDSETGLAKDSITGIRFESKMSKSVAESLVGEDKHFYVHCLVVPKTLVGTGETLKYDEALGTANISSAVNITSATYAMVEGDLEYVHFYSTLYNIPETRYDEVLVYSFYLEIYNAGTVQYVPLMDGENVANYKTSVKAITLDLPDVPENAAARQVGEWYKSFENSFSKKESALVATADTGVSALKKVDGKYVNELTVTEEMPISSYVGFTYDFGAAFAEDKTVVLGAKSVVSSLLNYYIPVECYDESGARIETAEAKFIILSEQWGEYTFVAPTGTKSIKLVVKKDANFSSILLNYIRVIPVV